MLNVVPLRRSEVTEAISDISGMHIAESGMTNKTAGAGPVLSLSKPALS
jgi:hypothetical protein